MSSSSLLISPSALAQRMKESGHPGGSSKIRLLDATWYMPGTPKDPRKEFSETGPRIPGSAEFWDVEEVADKTHPLKLGHMMPDAKTFADACCKSHNKIYMLRLLCSYLGLAQSHSASWHRERFGSRDMGQDVRLQLTESCFHVQSE